MHSVFIIENPLMDHVMHEDYRFLERFDAAPGTMQLVEHGTFRDIVRSSSGQRILPGGSGANTARALAKLVGPDADAYGRVAYGGSIGPDEAGAEFDRAMRRSGVDTRLATKDLPTGVSAIVVTPDHERTMFTSLGACRDYCLDDLPRELISDSRFFYSTGYMWDTEPQMRALFAAVEEAKRLGKTVCFDLADPFVVDRYYRELRPWVRDHVDILFANRRELSRMTDRDDGDESILDAAAGLAGTVVMKIGKDGCLARHGSATIREAAFPVTCRDTTGAGDSFAAGYLYGLIRGLDIDACVRLGNRIAGRIVAVDGVDYDLVDRADILAALD